jgi:hypothetical protein
MIKKNYNNALCLRSKPVIDVDCSWIIRGFCRGDIDCRVRQLINISLNLVEVGFDVNLVCDGEKRHHSKRAMVQRQAETQNDCNS